MLRGLIQKTRRYRLPLAKDPGQETDVQLFRIKFDNQLFVDRQIDVFALRQCEYAAHEIVAIDLAKS